MSAGARCRMIKSALDGDRDCTGTPIKAIHLLAGGLSDGGRARASGVDCPQWVTAGGPAANLFTCDSAHR
jgi:hypothetical protein